MPSLASPAPLSREIKALISWGAYIRPVHFSFTHHGCLEQCVFGQFCDCTGLSVESANFYLRTAAEALRFCDHLLGLADMEARKNTRQLDLKLPGFSPEFEEESWGDYDATKLHVACWLRPDGSLLIGSIFEADAIVLEDKDMILAFEQALRRFANAWAANKIDVRKANPLSFD